MKAINTLFYKTAQFLLKHFDPITQIESAVLELNTNTHAQRETSFDVWNPQACEAAEVYDDAMQSLNYWADKAYEKDPIKTLALLSQTSALSRPLQDIERFISDRLFELDGKDPRIAAEQRCVWISRCSIHDYYASVFCLIDKTYTTHRKLLHDFCEKHREDDPDFAERGFRCLLAYSQRFHGGEKTLFLRHQSIMRKRSRNYAQKQPQLSSSHTGHLNCRLVNPLSRV